MSKSTEEVEVQHEEEADTFESQARDEKPGEAWVIQEALGYIIGTVVKRTPFAIYLGADAVWVRDMGQMREAMATGRVVDCHPLPHDKIREHAIRHTWPWPHKVPSPNANSR